MNSGAIMPERDKGHFQTNLGLGLRWRPSNVVVLASWRRKR